MLTALLDYVSGFGDYLTESPWLFRWAVYVSVFILIFVALNHLITLGIKAYHRSQARRRSTPTQPPSTTTYNIENVLMGGHKQKEEQNIERLATEERRKAVKLSLAHAALVGELLHNDKPTTEQYESWSNVVAVMIWVALDDRGRVRLFYNDFEVSVDVLAEDSDVKQAIRRRLKYIHELIPQVDTLNVSPAFNAAEWIGHRPPHMKIPAQAQEVFNRVKEIKENTNQQ